MTPCAGCAPLPGAVNSVPGQVFVGWGLGWCTCPKCHGSGLAPEDAIPPWSPYPEPRPGAHVPRESDESLRVRAINAYGMWGALASVVLESRGRALDEIAAYLGVERKGGS